MRAGDADRQGVVEKLGRNLTEGRLTVVEVDGGVCADHPLVELVDRPVGEPLPAVAGLVGTVALDRGPHRAVQHEDALLQQRGQLCGDVGPDEL